MGLFSLKVAIFIFKLTAIDVTIGGTLCFP
jgi:hypothetical protein